MTPAVAGAEITQVAVIGFRGYPNIGISDQAGAKSELRGDNWLSTVLAKRLLLRRGEGLGVQEGCYRPASISLAHFGSSSRTGLVLPRAPSSSM